MRLNPQAPVGAQTPGYLFVMTDYGMTPRPDYMTMRPARAAPEKDGALQSSAKLDGR